MKNKIVFLIMILVITVFATNCTDNNQKEEQDASVKLETMVPEDNEEQSSEEKDLSREENEKDVLSEEENDELMNETLNTLYELEETINSLDEASDSDLQMPEE